jgi:hypothetical protein
MDISMALALSIEPNSNEYSDRVRIYGWDEAMLPVCDLEVGGGVQPEPGEG